MELLLKSASRRALVIAALLVSAVMTSAQAATLALHSSWRSLDGVSVTSWDGTGVTNATPVPGSYDYSHTVAAAAAPVLIPGSVDPLLNPSGSEFYDDFVFTVGDALANAVASTISLNSALGIMNLQARVYSFPGALPNVGSPAPGELTQVWASPFLCGTGCYGEQVIMPNLALAAGTYVLEFRGIVSGTVSGSYGGALNLVAAPVPLPAATWLLGSGLGLLALLRRRAAG